MSWTRLIESLVMPPAGLIWLGVAGLVLLARRKTRWGVGCLATSLLGLFLLSTPLAGSLLLETLDHYPPLPTAGPWPDAECVVVLGAGLRWGATEYGGDTVSGMALERLRYGARLARRSGRPVLVTGWSGEQMAETLETELHVDVRWIVGGANTYQNAVFSAETLLPEGIRRLYLVTHFWHMSRSVAAFRAAGLEPVPAPLGFAESPRNELAILSLLPRSGPLGISRLALHEWVGRAWYRLRYSV